MCTCADRGETDLALEPLRTDTRCELGTQHLDHNLSMKAALFGEKYARHSSAAELAREANVEPNAAWIAVARSESAGIGTRRTYPLPAGEVIRFGVILRSGATKDPCAPRTHALTTATSSAY